MIRLAVSCEGPTEREFVNRCLGPHLETLGIQTTPIPLSGPPNLDRIRSELKRLLPAFDRVTTLYDYYGFQRRPDRDPDGLIQAIAQMAPDHGRSRVIPYVQRYEFEALVFAAPEVAAAQLHSPALGDGMARILQACGGPEDIDDGYETCPSRRLKHLYPAWDKVLHGPTVVKAIGITRLCDRCPRFSAWVQRLEGLS